MTDLLPCPHCGNYPAKLTEVYDDEIRKSYVCIWKDCPNNKSVDKDEQARLRWNTRASTPSLAAAVEALRDAFVAGFNNSFEGFNREYPFGEDRATDEQVWEKIKDGFQDFLDARVCKEKK